MVLLEVIVCCLGLIVRVHGQGRLMDPPGRGSLWRAGYDTPINYNDNVLNCGGVKYRWERNQGKCGVCGDPWDSSTREHERGGKYASGTITQTYQSGSIIEILADIQNPSEGFFEVQICEITDTSADVTEQCFTDNVLKVTPNGDTRFYDLVPGVNKVSYILPTKLSCKHCVLRWKYRTADHYGCETDPTSKKEVCGFGLGPFYNEYFACSDISIVNTTVNLPSTQPDNRNNNGGNPGPAFSRSLSRQKRTVHVNSPHRPTSRPSNTPPYIAMPENQSFRKMPFTRLGRPTTENHRTQWSWGTSQTLTGRDFRRALNINSQPNARFQNTRLPSRNFPNNVDMNRLEIGQGEMFPGSMPLPALVQVNQPVVRRILRTSQATGGGVAAATLRSPIFRQIDTTHVQNTFMDPLNPDFGPKVSVRTVNHHIFSKHRIATKQCKACPFDQCLDKTLELDTIFPGLFEKPAEFLECKRYTKLFSLGNYKVLSEGLPSCSHPRFRRQLRSMPRVDDDDFGCCGTRPQVVLPLTVESDNESYNVVQLPNERNQFLVQGLCGHNSTTSCSTCVAENNFQWVLVYDPRVNTSPPVSFVPVKFAHYCRCLNPGRRFVG